MTTHGMDPEGFPSGGEFVEEAITLESRFPKIVMPRDTMWPLRLHDEETKAAAAEVLPKLVATLSEPVKPATQEQIHDLFSTNPHNRALPWDYKKKDGGLTYITGAYEGQPDPEGSTHIYDGISYQFDPSGRLVKFEIIEGERSYNSNRPRYQELLTYDDEGYLVERTTWGYIEPTVTDRFEYAVDEEGRKTPAKMARTLKVKSDDHTYEDSSPMTVDLANYEEWLETNPNGFAALTKEQLNPGELEITDSRVSEYRRGILFARPEELEDALVMYGDGSYLAPGDKTALKHNDKAFAEAHGDIGGTLFSLMARKGDTRGFVSSRITGQVKEKWKQVQKPWKKSDAERVHFGFDYDGAGHFHKTSGDVSITKEGIELTLWAAYVGDMVEEQLSNALGKRRGLRSAAIEAPINQTEREGYFFVDIQAACEKLGIPVTKDTIANYLREYLGENDEAQRSDYHRKYGVQPTLWEDTDNGIAVDLVAERYDNDSSTYLDQYFRHDGSALWGPLPRGIHRASTDKDTPKLRIVVRPRGNPFSVETTKRTSEILQRYIDRIEQTN